MIRLLNILFLGLAVLFFTVLALAMYKSVRYVNENQPYLLSQKESKTKSSTDNEDSFSFPLSGNDTTSTEDELPEIDFAAIDSLLDDDEELDSLIGLRVDEKTNGQKDEGMKNEGGTDELTNRRKDEGVKDEGGKDEKTNGRKDERMKDEGGKDEGLTTDDLTKKQEQLTDERSEIPIENRDQRASGSLAERTRRDGKETKDEEQKNKKAIEAKTEDAKILNKKPKSDAKTIAEAKPTLPPPSKSKAKPTSYNQTGKYYIAVGAFKDKSNANLVQSQLKKLGFKNIKRIKNNTFTLIRLQGYPKKSSAAKDLTKVRKYYKEAYVRKR